MFSKNNDKTISYVAFAFVYGYNENEMTVTNAELNILAMGYVTKQSEDSKDDSSVSAVTIQTMIQRLTIMLIMKYCLNLLIRQNRLCRQVLNMTAQAIM